MTNHLTAVPPWQQHRLDQPERVLVFKHRSQETSGNIRRIISWINIGWTGWSLAGAVFFLFGGLTTATDKTVWDAVGTNTVVGMALLVCGLVSAAGLIVKKLNRLGAILCALWCLATAIVLQFDTPQFDQGDIDAWLLLICSFTCVMRWALVTLEPYLDQ